MNESSSPDFWDERYAAGRMPWDFGDAPAALRDFLGRARAGNVLIPGCGTGYEVRAFARAGWRVDAVDFSNEAVQRAREFLGADANLVREADFFVENPNAPFDLIYERTFLCSLPFHLWPSYVQRVAASLRSGGLLAGFFFFGPEPEPPPHPLPLEGLSSLFGDAFEQIEDSPVADSLQLFAGKERWQVWRKK
ncbi:hypothetical protein BH09VER1_BH09VER1_11860 [soil metagenome]